MEVTLLALLAAIAGCLMIVVLILVIALSISYDTGKATKKKRACATGSNGIQLLPPLIVRSSSAMIQPDTDREKPSLLQRSFSFFKRKEPKVIMDDPLLITPDMNYVGKINFGVSYDKESCSLNIHILEAIDLPAMDLLGSSDPYVRLTLLPDRRETKITQIHKRNLNPKFDQVVSFRGHSMKKLHDMTLCMQVMDYDRFSQDDPIGEVLLPLKNVKFDHKPVYWKHLQEPTVRKEYQGEVQLSLCYVPDSSKLTVVVIKAKDLPSKEIASAPDTYVKFWLVHQGNKWEKRKTTVKHQQLTPLFNETFAFTVPKDKVGETQLVAAVMEYELITSNAEIGHCILGKRGGDSGQKHWKDIQAKPGIPVSMWHKLTPKW